MVRKIAIGGILIAGLSLAFAGLLATIRWGTIPAWDSVAPPNTNQQAPVSANIPSINYCDLADEPEKYDGQTIRVTATLYFMMHGYKFMDRACLADEKETAVLLNSEHEAKLAREMGMEEYNPWNFPRIVATGKFNRVTPNRKSDSVADNSNLIFEMKTVERVIKFPNE